MSAMSSPILRTGALSGLDNAARLEVANTMSKFVRRGAARALPLSIGALPEVGVTVINPGNATTAGSGGRSPRCDQFHAAHLGGDDGGGDRPSPAAGGLRSVRWRWM
jgi:hypothetical protein